MSTILVGRDNPKEVSIGAPFSRAAQDKKNAEAKEELVEAPVEDGQVEPSEEGDVPEAEEAAPKRRGKKRGKA